jgi:DNA-binding transcriptional LysR family regulator
MSLAHPSLFASRALSCIHAAPMSDRMRGRVAWLPSNRIAAGALVRLLPGWHVDAGPMSLYYAGRKLLPAKTRAFVDHVTAAFETQGLARKFAGA